MQIIRKFCGYFADKSQVQKTNLLSLKHLRNFCVYEMGPPLPNDPTRHLVIIVIFSPRSDGPLGVRGRRAHLGVPEDAVQSVFGAGVDFFEV
jgi:hypothetical protein